MTDLSSFDALGSDLGGEALRHMVRRWVIDREWAWDLGPTSFEWLGYRRPQSFRIESGRRGTGTRLVATTRVVDGVPDVAAAREALEGFNRTAKGSTWWVDDSGEITLHCATPIDETSLEAATHDLSVVALVQLFTGEVMAEAVAELVGGRPVVAEHPVSGPRADSDEILTMVEQALIPVGLSPSQFLRPEAIASARTTLEGSRWRAVADEEEGPIVVARWGAGSGVEAPGGGGRGDGTAEVPSEGRSGAVVDAAADHPAGRLLSRMRVEVDPISQDPDLGSGLFTRIIAPCDVGGDGGAVDPAAWALFLNRAERAGAFDGPTYGAWDVAEDEAGAVVHTWFTLSALYGADRVRERTTIALRRAEWAADLLA